MCQLSRIPRADQEPGSPVLDDFRHGRGTARHHGQAGRHRLGEDQPESFLNGRKAETVGDRVLYRQSSQRVTSPRNTTVSSSPSSRCSETQLGRTPGPLLRCGSARGGFARGGSPKRAAGPRVACAGTCAPPTAPSGGRPSRPDASAKRRRQSVRSIGSGTIASFARWDAVDLVGHRRRVAARHDDPIGARRVRPLPARLHREQDAHPAALVPQLVGDDSLEHHDEGAAAPPRPQESVEIDADRDVGRPRPQGDVRVVEPAVERVKAACAR